MGENDLKISKTKFPDKWNYSIKKLAYPYEYFNIIKDYQKPVNNFQKMGFFNKLKNKCPNDKEIEKTREVFNLFNIKKEKN